MTTDKFMFTFMFTRDVCQNKAVAKQAVLATLLYVSSTMLKTINDGELERLQRLTTYRKRASHHRRA